MKKSYILIVLFLIFVLFITVIGCFIVTGNVSINQEKDIFLVQGNKELYFNVYGYSIQNPNIIINPYGNSPLTALVMFETDDYSEVEITIKSKNGNSDINYKFAKDKYHMIPIYGLYADYNNEVIIRSEGRENIIYIKTDKIPDDFVYVDNVTCDNFMFYNCNYPYAIDIDGEIRWYLNKHCYGNITFLDNSRIIIGSDSYNEDGNTISFYKINLLGKVYNEYLLKGYYYGYNSLYENNLMVLSDKILLIDIQTGEIIKKYIENDGYDYLALLDGNIIVSKDTVFYKVIDDKLEEINYNVSYTKHSFYDNTSNYYVIPSERFGNLSETVVSEKKITLFNYEKVNELKDIIITRDVNRIKVINDNEDKIFVILDKFMDKRIYEVDDIKYINLFGLNGKYTVYLKINDKLYKTDYYIEV